ncbi:MAG: hypothetical protein GF320_00300 [Armatimonadia bacterium]|nr:hypothetical protein [Armatimonadia bacterium]
MNLSDRVRAWIQRPMARPVMAPAVARGYLLAEGTPPPPGGPAPRRRGQAARVSNSPAPLSEAQRRAMADPLAEQQPPGRPQPEDTEVPDGVRREEMGRTSIQSTGTRYPSLTASSKLLVQTGAMMFWACAVLAGILLFAVMVYFLNQDWHFAVRLLVGLVAGVALAFPIALVGRVLQLSLSVIGEMLVVTMDMEDSVRRIADSGER